MKMKDLYVPVVVILMLPAGIGTGYGSTDPGWQDEFNLEECTMSHTGSNDYFFLQPGYQLTLEGEEDGEVIQLIVSVLNETKVVDYTQTRVVEERESVDGELAEISLNYFSICMETGDIFYYGEEVDDYEDGEVVSHVGAWEAGIDGARPGLIIPANPIVGMKYYQEVALGVAEDRAEIISLSAVVVTPAGRFDGVLRVEETNPLEGNEKEYKFHAPDVGLVQDADLKLVSYVIPEAEEEEPEEEAPGNGQAMSDPEKRRKALAEGESGRQIHQRHMDAKPSSRGEYSPGTGYTLTAAGVAGGDIEAMMTLDVSVWKSNGAVVIMDVVGGMAAAGGQEYDIRVGYALYSVKHNVFSAAAVVVAGNGEVLPLRLYGTSAGSELATGAGGDPLMIGFAEEQKNYLGGWTLELDGSIEP